MYVYIYIYIITYLNSTERERSLPFPVQAQFNHGSPACFHLRWLTLWTSGDRLTDRSLSGAFPCRSISSRYTARTACTMHGSLGNNPGPQEKGYFSLGVTKAPIQGGWVGKDFHKDILDQPLRQNGTYKRQCELNMIRQFTKPAHAQNCLIYYYRFIFATPKPRFLPKLLFFPDRPSVQSRLVYLPRVTIEKVRVSLC